MGRFGSGWRRAVRRCLTVGLAAGVVCVGLTGSSEAQQQRKPRRPRRETNASREARIARTIQDTYSHRWEVDGGGGYLRWRGGEYAKRNNEVSWDVNTDYYLNPKLAIVGDAQGSFGHAYQQLPLQFVQIPRPQINEYFFTGGVNYRFYAKQFVALSGQATGGTAWGIFSGGAKGLTGPQVGLWQDGLRPAVKLAINADYNFFPNLAVRFSPTWIVTDFRYTPQAPLINSGTTNYTGAIQNSLGFNVGVVYRFGRQR